jgi:hypothetical protein
MQLPALSACALDTATTVARVMRRYDVGRALKTIVVLLIC